MNKIILTLALLITVISCNKPKRTNKYEYVRCYSGGKLVFEGEGYRGYNDLELLSGGVVYLTNIPCVTEVRYAKMTHPQDIMSEARKK